MSKVIMFITSILFFGSSFAVQPEIYTENNFISEISKISTVIEESREKYLTQYQIEDLLRDPSPQVRKAAVKNSKKYILNSSVYEKVIDIMENDSEVLDIRIEAARTLCYATGYSTVRDALRDLIKYRNAPKELKIMAYKALWTATNTSEIKDFLIDAVKYRETDKELKQAAICALFGAASDYNVRDRLLSISKDTSEDISLRLESIKSLFNAVTYYEVKDKLINIAKSYTEKKEIRIAAIKTLSGANSDSQVKSFLEDLIRWEKDEELKVTAIWAASPSINEINEYFHLPYRLHTGVVINPIEKE